MPVISTSSEAPRSWITTKHAGEKQQTQWGEKQQTQWGEILLYTYDINIRHARAQRARVVQRFPQGRPTRKARQQS
jgi:hypothetical protein